jgi:uncharacterized protein with ParB-like and HNH nuclease domain
MTVSQKPEKITDILKDKIFSIPLFQREFSWNLEQVSDLFYDIKDTDETGHFLGSLLLFNDIDSKKMEIVDGQQRMTTLFLLLFSLLKKLDDSDKAKAIERIKTLLFIIDPNDLSEETSLSEPRMETGRRDKTLFKSIIKGENYENHKDGRRKSHKNLTNALDFFRDRLDEIKKEDGFKGIIEFTQKVIKSEFIVMTAEKKSDKLLLFKTINARGLDLTEGDLIKNELCYQIGEYSIDDAIDTWDIIKGLIEKNGGKFVTFLFHYINSLITSLENRQELDKKRGISTWDKKNYPPVPEKYIFDIYSITISNDGPKIFLENLHSAAKEYIKFINPANDSIYLKSIKSMGVNKCFPLLLSVVKKIKPKNFTLICQKIDALTFRHSILRNDPKELEKFYYILSEDIKSDDNVPNAIKKIISHPNFKDEAKFKNEFIHASLKSSVNKMILDRITKYHSEGVDFSNKDTHIEHIMPRKPKGEWLELYEEDNEEYKDYLNRLGNLTILQDKKNIRARNKDFSKKKEYYKESRLKITNLLTEYNNWNYEEILNRQKYLYEESKKFWE